MLARSASPVGKLFLKGAWSGHVSHLNVVGHQPYLQSAPVKLEWSNFMCVGYVKR